LREYIAAHVKPRTYEHYESAIRIHLKPEFGKYMLKDICPEHVDAFKTYKLLPEASEGAGERLDALVFSENVIPFPTRKTVQARQPELPGIEPVENR